jgi:hypothetical protein
MTNHPPLGLVDVFAATIPTLTFTPSVHVNYAETVLPMRDGLPKLKDWLFSGFGVMWGGLRRPAPQSRSRAAPFPVCGYCERTGRS